MSLTDANERDLRGLVEELENLDVFALGEAEAWYEGIDEANVVSDYMMVNEAIVDTLEDRDGVQSAVEATATHQTRSFY